jgi:hypothetical protein
MSSTDLGLPGLQHGEEGGPAGHEAEGGPAVVAVLCCKSVEHLADAVFFPVGFADSVLFGRGLHYADVRLQLVRLLDANILPPSFNFLLRTGGNQFLPISRQQEADRVADMPGRQLHIVNVAMPATCPAAAPPAQP